MMHHDDTLATHHVVNFTPQALETVNNMLNRIHQVRANFGEREANRLGYSFGISLAKLISYGGTIYRDGELGLVSHAFIVVGMVFHREDQVTTADRVYGSRLWNEKDQAFFRTFPESGEWSLHS